MGEVIGFPAFRCTPAKKSDGAWLPYSETSDGQLTLDVVKRASEGAGKVIPFARMKPSADASEDEDVEEVAAVIQFPSERVRLASESSASGVGEVITLRLPNAPHMAYNLYVRASQLDENPATYDEAEGMYRRAILLDPKLAIAHTNLGNILFRRGEDVEAETLYRAALAIDDRQPEAHYNLGYVRLERGDAAGAAQEFRRAIERDSRFADAHFNLAMALEQMGSRSEARTHWKRYLDLEPNGTWADVARGHVGSAASEGSMPATATATTRKRRGRSKRSESGNTGNTGPT